MRCLLGTILSSVVLLVLVLIVLILIILVVLIVLIVLLILIVLLVLILIVLRVILVLIVVLHNSAPFLRRLKIILTVEGRRNRTVNFRPIPMNRNERDSIRNHALSMYIVFCCYTKYLKFMLVILRYIFFG